MPIFNGYVSLPEGTWHGGNFNMKMVHLQKSQVEKDRAVVVKLGEAAVESKIQHLQHGYRARNEQRSSDVLLEPCCFTDLFRVSGFSWPYCI